MRKTIITLMRSAVMLLSRKRRRKNSLKMSIFTARFFFFFFSLSLLLRASGPMMKFCVKNVNMCSCLSKLLKSRSGVHVKLKQEETDRQTDRQTETDRQRDRQTDRDRQTETERVISAKWYHFVISAGLQITFQCMVWYCPSLKIGVHSSVQAKTLKYTTRTFDLIVLRLCEYGLIVLRLYEGEYGLIILLLYDVSKVWLGSCWAGRIHIS